MEVALFAMVSVSDMNAFLVTLVDQTKAEESHANGR